MDSEIFHVHFGPGKLGLGFVVPTIRESHNNGKCHLTSFIAGRDSEECNLINSSIKNEKVYKLKLSDGIIKDMPIKDLFYLNEDNKELFNIIASSKTQIITTAVCSPNKS